jgi:hypothetical protein
MPGRKFAHAYKRWRFSQLCQPAAGARSVAGMFCFRQSGGHDVLIELSQRDYRMRVEIGHLYRNSPFNGSKHRKLTARSSRSRLPAKCLGPLNTCIGVLTLTLAAQAGPALEPWMDEMQLQAAFSGKTVRGYYVDGRGFSESYKADGAIEYQEYGKNGLSSHGYWSLRSGSFCTFYALPELNGGCFRVRQTSQNCYDFYYVARSEVGAEWLGQVKPDGAQPNKIVPNLIARAAATDRETTCSADMNV